MSVYILWLLILDATTGELIGAEPASKPMTIAECLERQVETGPQKVVDGKVKLYVCARPRDGIST